MPIKRFPVAESLPPQQAGAVDDDRVTDNRPDRRGGRLANLAVAVGVVVLAATGCSAAIDTNRAYVPPANLGKSPTNVFTQEQIDEQVAFCKASAFAIITAAAKDIFSDPNRQRETLDVTRQRNFYNEDAATTEDLPGPDVVITAEPQHGRQLTATLSKNVRVKDAEGHSSVVLRKVSAGVTMKNPNATGSIQVADIDQYTHLYRPVNIIFTDVDVNSEAWFYLATQPDGSKVNSPVSTSDDLAFDNGDPYNNCAVALDVLHRLTQGSPADDGYDNNGADGLPYGSK